VISQAESAVPEIKWLESRMSRWDDLVAMAAETGVRITPETAMKTAAYFACARVIAETVASLPLHLYRRLDDHNSERAKDLPLYNVLAKRPNGWQTRYEWVEQMCLHLGFYGNSYQLKVPGDRGSVDQIYALHPAGMKVVQESDKALAYLYTDPSTGRQQAYRDDQIMHVRWLSFDGINGEVPVELGRDAIALARSLEQYAASFYRNNAQPGIILHTDQALPREVREQLRDQWESAHRGPAKAGKTAILSNGLKADTVSATNQESQLAELWMQSLLAICRIWRMPPHMIQELGRATWGNLQSEMVSFEKFTIGPWLRRIEGAIERDVLPEDGDLYAEFLVEGLLRGDITTRYQAYEVAIRNGWLTPEEVRMKENLGPLPETEDDSPGEVEDTPGDTVEDVPEVAAGTSEASGDQRAFCPTGAGGGIDNSCSAGEGVGSESAVSVSTSGSFMQATTEGGVVGGHVKSGALHISVAQLDKGKQGKGIGKQMYKRLIDEAHAQGLDVYSDTTVEMPAVRVYQSLKKDGYEVITNPHGVVPASDDGPEAWYGHGGKPVFQVKPKKGDASTEAGNGT
jgi:HK97 family phage portal protein